MNLQHALGTWVPNGVLNFFFKYSYSRRVSDFKLYNCNQLIVIYY